MFFSSPGKACPRGAFRVVQCPPSVVRHASPTIALNISSQTAGPVWTKLGRNFPWDILYKNCSHNLISSKTMVAMATKWNFLSNSVKFFSLGWWVILGFNATLTARVISLWSVTHMCFSGFLTRVLTQLFFLSKATDYFSHMLLQR